MSGFGIPDWLLRHSWLTVPYVHGSSTMSSLLRPLQAQADSAGMLMDEQDAAFSLAELEGAQESRPAPTAGRHTKRRR